MGVLRGKKSERVQYTYLSNRRIIGNLFNFTVIFTEFLVIFVILRKFTISDFNFSNAIEGLLSRWYTDIVLSKVVMGNLRGKGSE